MQVIQAPRAPRADNLAARLSLPLGALLSLPRIVWRRAIAHRGLFLAMLLGLTAAATLLAGVPIFAEGVATGALRQQLAAPGDASGVVILRHAPGRAGQPLTPEQFRTADRFAVERAPSLLGLPITTVVRMGQTDPLPILVGAASAASTDYAGYGYLAFADDLPGHVDLSEGRWPRPGRTPEGELEAVISTAGLDELGILVGDSVRVLAPGSGQAGSLTVRVVGRWLPRDEADPYWLGQLDRHRLALFVPEDTFLKDVPAVFPRVGREHTWGLVFDPFGLRAGDAGRASSALVDLRNEAQRLVRGLRVDAAPDDVLEAYRRRVFFLQVLLLAVAAPLALIVLQFVVSISGMLVDRQKAEIALLRSRGSGVGQVIGLYLLETLLIGALAIAVSPALGALLADALGRADGFLTFGGSGLPILLTSDALALASTAVGIGVVATVLPVIGAAGQTIVSYKSEVARTLRPPLAQRLFLDLLPVPVALYGYYLLAQRRSVLPVGEAGDAFADPLMLLVPAVWMIAAALLVLRLLPLVLLVVERLARPVAAAQLLLALRHLARQPYGQSGLVLMLCLTTALGAFSASAAKTLDRNEEDAAAYRVGADLQVSETGAFDEESGEWTLLPVGEHLEVPGVLGAARALRTKAVERLGDRGNEVTVLAVDPYELTGVAAWRPDYADRPLAQLLGHLLVDEAGILVDRRFLEAQRLRVGDELALNIRDQTVDFVVAGALDYFPTLYPEDGPFFVLSLDYLFDQVVPMPYDVWLRLAPDADPAAVVSDLNARGLAVVRFQALRDALAQDREDLTRRGVFGLLGIGFLIAAALSALGLAIHSYLSFHRRLVEVGILRSIGLDRRQLVGLFVSEQAILIVAGLLSGAGIGPATSRLFIPFLQVRATAHAGTPPFVVVPAGDDLARLCLGFAGCLALALPISLFLLARVRLHEAVKLGEEQG